MKTLSRDSAIRRKVPAGVLKSGIMCLMHFYIGSRLLNGLLSPERWNSSNANVWNVHGSDNPGNLNNDNVNNVNGVRPEFL